jgi:phage tail-like protein
MGMNEANFITINIEARWGMGKEIVEDEAIELRHNEPVNLQISSKGLSLKPGSAIGTYMSNALDSTMAGCVWHRLIVDAELPENALAEVAFAVAEKEVQDIGELVWSPPLINPKDMLIPGQKGRYLWLKIIISTKEPEDKAPVIKSLKLCFPRETYLRHLPAIYQEDSQSRNFLERYLSVFETVLANLERIIDDVPRWSDAIGTSSEFLPWLSTWLGAVYDENWPEAKWREFLNRAAELYKQRGTPAGLRNLVKLYSGKYPIIVERALLRCENPEFGKVLDKLFGCKYSFCVLVQPDQVTTEKDRKVLKRMIAVDKPAHTLGGLVVVEPRIRLDWHSYLGKNTILNEPELDIRIGKAVVPINTAVQE